MGVYSHFILKAFRLPHKLANLAISEDVLDHSGQNTNLPYLFVGFHWHFLYEFISIHHSRRKQNSHHGSRSHTPVASQHGSIGHTPVASQHGSMSMVYLVNTYSMAHSSS